MGYKNPPKAYRFTKDKSGNPPGRPRQAVQRMSDDYVFRKVASQEVPVELDGRPVMMTRWEALIRQIQIMAYTDPSAARLLDQIREAFPGEGSTDVKSILVLGDDEINW